MKKIIRCLIRTMAIPHLSFVIFFIACCLLPVASCFSQAPPQRINYQAVARDAGGNPLAIATVTVSFDIHRGGAVGPISMNETHVATTNQFGLFNLFIGSVNPTAFDTIGWGKNSYWLQVWVNLNNMGTTQFLSVPYALHSKTADSIVSPPGALIWKRTADSVFLSTNSNRVGIGTSSPGAKLHIAGNMKIVDGTQGANKILTSDAAGLATWQPAGAGAIGGSGILNYVPKFTPDGSTLGNSQIFDNGASVGIGTTTPFTKLHISSSAVGVQELLRLSYPNAWGNGAALSFYIGYNDAESARISSVYNNWDDADLRFFTLGTTFGERMRINNNGNVGIGTASPGAKLDVAGTTRLGTSGTSFSGLRHGVVSVDPPQILANTEATFFVALAGAAAGDRIFLTPPSTFYVGIIYKGADVVAGGVNIQLVNVLAAAGDAPPTNWSYLIIRP